MMFVNIHFQNKQLILHEVLIGPRCVMVPVGSVAYLKTTSTNNSKRWNIHNNMSWILNMPKASLLTCHLEFNFGCRMWLNLSTSCNYYHHRVIISTRGTEICSRDFVSRCIFRKYFVKIQCFYNSFAQVE